MAHPSKKKQLPPDILERDDHDLMESIFGKEVMVEVDKIVEERSEEKENKDNDQLIE